MISDKKISTSNCLSNSDFILKNKTIGVNDEWDMNSRALASIATCLPRVSWSQLSLAVAMFGPDLKIWPFDQ